MMINKAIISGGGTGGHIFPAIAIANQLKTEYPDIEILFIGAEGKMEMEKIPAAGYKIIGLPIRGLQRKLTLKNLLLPFKIISSLFKARKIIKDFKPQVVIGVGGYASAPTLKAANWLKIPTFIQEQNCFAGKTNKLLANKARKICVAYTGLEKFFPENKIVFTGNPVRQNFLNISAHRAKALEKYAQVKEQKVLLVIGGSLGARTLNNAVKQGVSILQQENIFVIWQCGKLYKQALLEGLEEENLSNFIITDFISEMELAYAAADVIISRAGALSVSELCLVGKPAILVPSPNVAEDHQTHNAMALVKNKAALLVKDNKANDVLIQTALQLLKNTELQKTLSTEIKKMAKPNATKDIVKTVIDNLA